VLGRFGVVVVVARLVEREPSPAPVELHTPASPHARLDRLVEAEVEAVPECLHGRHAPGEDQELVPAGRVLGAIRERCDPVHDGVDLGVRKGSTEARLEALGQPLDEGRVRGLWLGVPIGLVAVPVAG
jgi:hypothetical protein